MDAGWVWLDTEAGPSKALHGGKHSAGQGEVMHMHALSVVMRAKLHMRFHQLLSTRLLLA